MHPQQEANILSERWFFSSNIFVGVSVPGTSLYDAQMSFAKAALHASIVFRF